MKKYCIIIWSLFLLSLCGCKAFKTTGSPGAQLPVPQAEGTTYKRSLGIGTGIDPQAKAIEGNLGYKQAGS
jgi:hypothetical protein